MGFLGLILLSTVAFAAEMPAPPAPCLPPAGIYETFAGWTSSFGHAISRATKRVRAAAAAASARRLEMPRIVTGAFHTQQQVCADARARNPGKSVALVAVKTHVCDREAKVCLRVSRMLADSCNTFARDGFALYQTRNYRNSPDRSHDFEEDPALDDINTIWGTSGPAIIALDLENCVKLGQAGPGIRGISGASDPGASERFRLFREQILAIPGVSGKIGAEAAARQPSQGCLSQPEPTLDEAWNALEAAHVRQLATP